MVEILRTICVKRPKWYEILEKNALKNIHSISKHQKIEGGPFGEIFISKKSHNAEKN